MSAKFRRCGRPTPGQSSYNGCEYARMKGKQSCVWHWLLRQSSDVQALNARARLGVAAEPRRARVPAAEWPEGERWCAGCQSFVPLFYVTGSRCKACASMASHASRLESTYGIDAAEYDRIFKTQGGRCAICRGRPASKRFAVDHDHKTGEVRGILCSRCNHDLLGGAHDDIVMLWRAVTYLAFPTAGRPEGFVPAHGLVVEALRRTMLEREAEGQKELPAAEEPPF